MAINIETNNIDAVHDDSEKNNETSAISNKNDNSKVSDENTFDYLNEELNNEEEEENQEENEESVKPHKKNNGFNKRINKLTREKSELQQKIIDYEIRLKELENSKSSNKKLNSNEEPNIDDFDDYSDYIKAVAKYEVSQDNKKRLEEEFNKTQLKLEEEKISEYNKRLEKAKKRYGEDNWESIRDIEVNISEIVAEELLTNEYGPDILYYLHKNVDEGNRIFQLSKTNQIKEILKIEEKLKEKLKTRVSKAPDPIKPNTNGKNYIKDPNKMDFQEYKKWRQGLVN